jgi:CheY-like chemotaxis protein
MSRAKAKCLLIADDHPEMLAAYSAFFRNQGFYIRTAANGADAFTEYCVWYPDAVLLDIEMPLLDGRGVARAIRLVRALPAPLLLATTGLTSLSETDESIRAGFDQHFTKPVRLPVILAAINRGLAPSKTQNFGRVTNRPAEES